MNPWSCWTCCMRFYRFSILALRNCRGYFWLKNVSAEIMCNSLHLVLLKKRKKKGHLLGLAFSSGSFCNFARLLCKFCGHGEFVWKNNISHFHWRYLFRWLPFCNVFFLAILKSALLVAAIFGTKLSVDLWNLAAAIRISLQTDI